jgi:hypothetical protein
MQAIQTADILIVPVVLAGVYKLFRDKRLKAAFNKDFQGI